MTNPDEDLKRSYIRYESCGGGYELISELTKETAEGKPDGWANHPDVGLVRVVRYPSGFEGAWSWNRFTQQPIYMGKAPKRRPKPEQAKLPAASVPRLAPPQSSDGGGQDVEVVIIRRPSQGLLNALFGRE